MTATNEPTKTPMLEDSIEPAPWSADAKTMKTIVQDKYGSTPEDVLRLAEIHRPTIGDDEVLVRVCAASVDRGTWHLMTGLPNLMRIMGFGFRRPKALNPGRCLAGTVEAVGRDVTEFKPGDEVYGTCNGSFAEYVVTQRGCSPLNRHTCPSSRRRRYPFPGSPRCRVSVTAPTCDPGRRF